MRGGSDRICEPAIARALLMGVERCAAARRSRGEVVVALVLCGMLSLDAVLKGVGGGEVDAGVRQVWGRKSDGGGEDGEAGEGAGGEPVSGVASCEGSCWGCKGAGWGRG